MSLSRLMRSAALVITGLSLASCGVPESEQGTQELGATEQGLLTLVTCPVGANVTSYSPPITNTPQDTQVSASLTLSNCYSLLGGVTSATSSSVTFRPRYSCLDLLAIIPITSTLTWNTGETSTFVQTQITTRVEGLTVVLTQVGTVRAGKFEGATVVRTVTLLSTDLDACSSPEGLARLNGTATLTLLGLL